MPKGEHLKGKKNGIISANDGAMEFDKFTILTKTDKSGKEIDVVRINLPSDMAMAIGLWNKASKDPKWFDLLLKVKRDMLLPKQIEQKTTILGLDSEFVD